MSQAPGPAAVVSLAPQLETGDIQGLVAAGYGRLRAARYLLF